MRRLDDEDNDHVRDCARPGADADTSRADAARAESTRTAAANAAATDSAGPAADAGTARADSACAESAIPGPVASGEEAGRAAGRLAAAVDRRARCAGHVH